MNNSGHHERERFFGAAKVVASLTAASRVLGLIRDMVIVPLGRAALADRFWMAFTVPNLFRRLFGEGALSAAFVPIFTDVAESKGWERARLVLANVAGLLAVALAGLVVLIELALWAAWAMWPGDWLQATLLGLTAIMLPFMFTICLLALGSAALNCKGHFAYPAFAPILLNVALIVTAYWIAPALARGEAGRFAVIAVSLVAAGVVQLIGVIWLLRKMSLPVMLKLRPVLPEVKQMAKLMAPMIIPLSVLQFSAFADRIIALAFAGPAENPYTPLRDGVVRCLYAAGRLYQLPLGILAISVATVIFPLFSRYAARNDISGLRDVTNRALRLGAFLGIPAAVGLIMLAKPIIYLIFERGEFVQRDTQRAALILRMYCLGMWAYFWNHILLRAFFAIKQPRWPLVTACSLTGVNVVFVLCGIFTPLKSGAIGLATACTQSANALVLMWILRNKWEGLGIKRIAASLLRTGLAAGLMAAIIWPILKYGWPAAGRLAAALGWERLCEVLIVAASVVAGMLAFFAAAALLRCPELRELRQRPGKDTGQPR
ncbi:MAG: murein biosynthesis integral membrane protein MurJ [Planctomycetota bacterium]|jgi:putative peptidoglycan lipid II flippase